MALGGTLDEIEHVSFMLPAFLGILGMLHTHKKIYIYIFTSQTPSDPIIKYSSEKQPHFSWSVCPSLHDDFQPYHLKCLYYAIFKIANIVL